MMAAVADQIAIALDRARQFSNEARTDHLTGLANRREFERVIEREVALAERHSRQLTVMMIDVDNLKKINDRHGHSAGDDALKLVAQAAAARDPRVGCVRQARRRRVRGRHAGDRPASRAWRSRAGCANSIQAMNLGARSTTTVEVSIGLGAWRPGMDWQALVQVADVRPVRGQEAPQGGQALVQRRAEKSGDQARGRDRSPARSGRLASTCPSPQGGAVYSTSASSRALTIASTFECTPSLLPRLRMCVRTVV